MISYLTENRPLVAAFAGRSPARGVRRGAPIADRVFRAAPRLAEFLRPAEIVAVKGPLDRPISGLAIDSRRAAPGSVFFALPGRRTDGAQFIDEAISRGAVAVVSRQLPLFPPAGVTFVRVADPRAVQGAVAQRFYRNPDRDLAVIGVTGTAGKTTVAHVLKHLLEAEERVGLLGTICYDLGARTVPALRTTPEALDTFGLLAQMRGAGCHEAIVEVSSQGLEQRRVRGLQFAAAIFTNLAPDHLDAHGTLESYAAIKARLFTGDGACPPKISIVNADDPYGRRLAALLTAGGATRVVTYGEHPTAAVRLEKIILGARRTAGRLVWPGGSAIVDSPLTGGAGVGNTLAALATAWALGRDLAACASRLRSFTGVAGRMERIDAGQPFEVVVDYAHTEVALRRALGELRAITRGRVLAVFGCGGHGDRSQRPRMTRAAQEGADFTFATADNPRREGLARIFDDMRPGVIAADRIAWIEGRRRAIELAFRAAAPGDCVLIAGKGHESCQELADTIVPFDDRHVARELLRERVR
ncbi:MAG: UDP-N-acetylmuramoyl-L-alanyl-D-glutamate--2,6-diaminopimelate ligase [Opitutaceae bacterium]|nr:UDP-N-acetylmuramoyl-L-alanyl-D-glutamate--2,6-diaminopimelate ligase [Opitutaceae bacterium]